jgi:hypothetical protein
MNEQRSSGETLIELLIILLPIFLSFLFGKLLFRYLGWWSVLPGVILGFGSVALIFWILIRFFDRSDSGSRSSGS